MMATMQLLSFEAVAATAAAACLLLLIDAAVLLQRFCKEVVDVPSGK